MAAPLIKAWAGDAAVGLAVAAGGSAYYWLAATLPGGANGEPGPAAFPRFLAIAMVAGGLACAVRAWRARERDGDDVALYETNAALGAIALVAACLAFEPLGFAATTAAFLAFLFRLLARLRPVAAVAAGAGASAVLWTVFVHLLGVGLPPGPFGG